MSETGPEMMSILIPFFMEEGSQVQKPDLCSTCCNSQALVEDKVVV